MKQPDTPKNENDRQAALVSTQLLQDKPDARFDRITRLARELFSVPISLVSLIDNNRQWFKSRQGLDAKETPRDISFCGHAILGETPFIVQDALEDPRFADNPLVCGAPDIRFYAGVPLKTPNGFRIGTLCIIDNKPRDFSAQQTELLVDLASTLEALIAADVTAQQSYQVFESSIQDEQRRAQLVLEGTQVGTWQWNVQTGETIFNERWAEICGYTLQELEPISINTWMSLAHPHDLAESEALCKAHFAGESKSYDCKCRMRHKDGHWVWVHARGKVFEWTENGEPLLMYGTHADISTEVAYQKALKESRDELNSLVNNMPGVTYRCLPDDNWTMLYISGQVDKVSGYSADEIINNKSICYADLIHPDDAQVAGDAVTKAIEKGESWRVDYRVLHKDGSYRWVEERGHCVFDDFLHEQVLEGFIIDITREKTTALALEKHNKLFALLSEIAFAKYETLDDKINHALAKANTYLNMECAIVSDIDSATYTVEWIHSTADTPNIAAGQTFPVENTWCCLLEKTGGYREFSELFIFDVAKSEFQEKHCNQVNPVGSYAGVAFYVDNKFFGTLNFSSSQPRKADFDDAEKAFVRLLANWLSDTLTVERTAERFSKLVKQLPGVVYQFRQYPNGHLTFPFSTPQIQALYKLTPEQAAQDASPAFDYIHSDDLQHVSDSINDSAMNMSDWSCTYRVGSKKEGYRWVKGIAAPEQLSDGSTLWHGFIQDVHEQELARQQLINSESRLRGLFDFSPIGIALNDFESGQFLDLNNALLATTGYTRKEFVALSYFDVTPIEYMPEEEKALADMKTKGRYGPFEKEYIRKDGSRYPVRLQGMVSEERNGRKVIWSLIEDITERRKLDQMKDQFIATVSHELRTPLTSIRGSLDLLDAGAAGELPEKGQPLVQNAKRNAYRLSSLINDLLDIEKLVAGRVDINLRKQRLSPIIDEVIESMANYRDDNANISLVFVGERYNGAINVDDERLAQALRNLVSNAMKFSPENGRVEISVIEGDAKVCIKVRDYGPGVDAEFQKHLFQRFAQADSSDKRKLPGTGLGLSITHEIVTQLNGRVYYQDAQGGGSEFVIELPVSQ